MSRILGLTYGLLSYAIGFGSLAYAFFFLNNWLAPRTIDSEPLVGGAAGSPGLALAINLALAMVFALQHSVMARASFKRKLTRVIPAFAERSTYVLASGLALILLYVLWQPMSSPVWAVEAPALRIVVFAVQALGWAVLVGATFMLSHGELFGLSQVFDYLKGRDAKAPCFRTPGLYKLVRHPIQLGVLLIFWATPNLSVGYLVLNVAITGYICVALVFFEEKDLRREFPDAYPAYQERVGMLFPKLGGSAGAKG